MANDHKDDNLEGLSDEERAALEETEEDGATPRQDDEKGAQENEKDEEKAQAAEEAAAATDKVVDKDEAAKDGEDKAAADTEGAAADEKGDTAEAEGSEDDAEAERPAVPPYVPPAVENYETQIKAIQEERRALVAKFQDGEITLDVMLEKRDELDEKRDALRDQQRSHDLLRTQSEHDAKRTWEIEVAHFQRAHKEYSVDKDGKPVDAVMFNALDGIVKQLAADPANADKPAHWFLDEAHDMIVAKMQPPKPATKETVKEGDVKPAAKSRKPDLSVVPKTLADIPAAESEKPATDEFAHLDKLTGLELEQAVARLTPDQQARYANG